MDADEYRVSAPPVVVEQLHALLSAARRRGIFSLAGRSYLWIVEELGRYPMSFGESRGELRELQLHLRVAFVGPIMVDSPFTSRRETSSFATFT